VLSQSNDLPTADLRPRSQCDISLCCCRSCGGLLTIVREILAPEDLRQPLKTLLAKKSLGRLEHCCDRFLATDRDL
jgi:hypothetical protein